MEIQYNYFILYIFHQHNYYYNYCLYDTVILHLDIRVHSNLVPNVLTPILLFSKCQDYPCSVCKSHAVGAHSFT